MEGIIQSQVRDINPDEVEELILDKFRGPFISPSDALLILRFANLQYLSLTGCGLKSLDNFPSLPSLVKLELCDNKLRGSLKPLSVLSSLTMLSLAGNQISSMEALSDISNLEQLASLDLFGCPVTSIQDYEAKVFGMFRNLQVLDGKDKNGEEVSVDDEDDDEEDEEEDDEDLSDFIEDDDEPVKKRKNTEDSLIEDEDKARDNELV